MARIYQRSENGPWWGDWTTLEGKRHQRSLRTRDKGVARQLLKRAELGQTPRPAKEAGQRLSIAIDRMIATLHDKAEATREMYREKGRRILATLGNPLIHEVSRAMLGDYIALRRSADPLHGGAKDHTISKELITIRRALKEAVDSGYLKQMPPWPKFSPKYVPRDTWLTVDQFEMLKAELEDERVLWAALAALGGMRASEVEALTWAHINFDTGTIKVPGTKTRKSRRPVPIAPALMALLVVAPGSGCSEAIAVVEPWTNVRRDLQRACKRAGVPRVSPNDLRRTFASWLVNQGVDLLTVAALLGHSSTRMVEMVYGKLADSTLRAAIGRLPGSVPTYVPALGSAPGETGSSGHVEGDDED